MSTQPKEIIITTDWDGALGVGPLPLGTWLKLLAGEYVVPESTEAQEKKSNSSRNMFEQLFVFYHWIRPFRVRAVEGLRSLQATAKTKSEVKISFGLLSGRKPHLHEMSKRKLRKSVPDLFDETNTFLNEGANSGKWKADKAREFVDQGKTLFHIEDDLDAALQMSVVGENVTIYLIKNESNRSELLAKNKIILPSNVIMVEDYSEAIHKISFFLNLS